jgi:hypothetical protein
MTQRTGREKKTTTGNYSQILAAMASESSFRSKLRTSGPVVPAPKKYPNKATKALWNCKNEKGERSA